MCFHPRGNQKSSSWLHSDAWLDFNMLQVGHGGGLDNPNRFILAYTPAGKTVGLNLRNAGNQQFEASWFNPRNGSLQAMGQVSKKPLQAFDPPGEPCRGNDWVLVLATTKND
jgi:hypothetical protein